jgi:curved DNA-binding protein CbpA
MAVVPYLHKALHLLHTATDEQIKRAYRELTRRHHPDRLALRHSSRSNIGAADASGDTEKEEEEEEKKWTREHEPATAGFAENSSANALLSDPQRMAEYDHLYRFEGYGTC